MRDKYPQILAVLKATSVPLFSLGILAYLGAVLLASVRLMLIAKAQTIPMTYLESVSYTCIGYFFNNFLPTSIGGDVVKAYYLSKKCPDKTGPYTSVFIDRAIGLVTMVFMAFIALFFADSGILDRRLKLIIYAITACSALGVVFMLNESFARKFSALLVMVRPLEDKLKKAYRAVNSYRHHKILISWTLAISVASQLFFFLSIGVLALSIGSRIGAMDLLLRMPIVSVVSLLPSINGLGLREGASVLLFGPLIGNANAFAVSILVVATLLLASLAGALIYAMSPQFRVRIRDLDKEAPL
jgi:uncharacterized protein (TIRG00374 family)